MSAWYNEIEPYAVEWLKNLAAAGHIAPGVVEPRSITELRPDEIGDGQAHFFAGIGGWSYALRLAGWPDDVSVWTGSCPCQPFSSASRGRGGGFASPKHLWPIWRDLIAQRRPAIVLGEQVATGAGPSWFAQVREDLEARGYAVGGMELCASLLGFAPRERLFFAAYTDGKSECARAINAQMAGLPSLAGLAADDEDDVHTVVQESDGFSTAMGQRRAYGNAINPQLAAVFVRTVMESL